MVDNALKELEVKRELENKEAELHKEKRDKLNNEAKKWLNERNVFNNKLKDLISEANKLRVLRDEYNEKVKNEKNERSKWYRASLQFEEDLVNMKKEKQPKNGTPLWKLKKELKELEFKQMTSVLTKQKEDELVQSISRLQSQIKEANESLYRDPEINELAKKLEEAKEKSENAHQQVNENANLAQEYHEQMMKIYESVDELRKKIDEAQEEFIKIKNLTILSKRGDIYKSTLL